MLLASCGDDSYEGGLLLEADLEPLSGVGGPVKPAIYSGNRFQVDERWIDEDDGRRVARVVVIDNVPSQANRLEAALDHLAIDLGLPSVILDLEQIDALPPHLPSRLTGFRFPHRQADAYLRDASLGGTHFPRTETGRAILAATADRPAALFQWFPQALLFGFWQSHLGKKGSQAKLARSWVSEIIGIEPASVDTRTLGIKGDPLNLSVDEKVVYDPDDPLDWTFAAGEKKSGGSKKQESLSEIGLGQVPFRTGQEALAAVSCRRIVQRSTLSLAGLRRVWCGSPEANAAGRALLASLGLVGHVAAFGRSFSLRSGCDLRASTRRWTWLGESDDVSVEPLDLASASALFRACVERAESTGLPVGGRWQPELVLRPSAELEKVIRATYPVAD
jgi:CRISPR-associated protein Csb1